MDPGLGSWECNSCLLLRDGRSKTAIESFNCRLHDNGLNVSLFFSLADVHQQ